MQNDKVQYKALVCDVDGTIIYNQEHSMPTKRVSEAVQQASKKIAVSIATARPYDSAFPIIKSLQLTAPCIITGGAQIVDPITGKILLEKALSKENLEAIYAVAKKNHVSLLVTESGRDFPLLDTYIYHNPLDIYTHPLSLEQANDFMRKISHVEHIAVHKIPAWIIDGIEKVHVVMSHPEATKQQGILEIAKILGISTREIIGVGEGYNDFPLLMACGFKVAMGNAVDEIKAIADYIAPSVEDDGVVDVIEKFILYTTPL